VSCSDGHTYERCAIERWLQDNDTSPMTREEIRADDLTPNVALRKSIAEWRERQQQHQQQSEIPFSELKLGLGSLGYFPHASSSAAAQQQWSSASSAKHLLVVCCSSATYGVKLLSHQLHGCSVSLSAGGSGLRSQGSYKKVQKAEWRGRHVAVATVSVVNLHAACVCGSNRRAQRPPPG
jgi:hypothetical protein